MLRWTSRGSGRANLAAQSLIYTLPRSSRADGRTWVVRVVVPIDSLDPVHRSRDCRLVPRSTSHLNEPAGGDRQAAARREGELHPRLRGGLAEIHAVEPPQLSW